jgi:uncharacterized protein (DUF885 family)
VNSNTREQLKKAGALAFLQVLILSAPAAEAQQPGTGPRADVDRIAAQVTRLADAYVAEFVTRFPDHAELSGLAVARRDALTDNSLEALRNWQALEDRWAEEIEPLDAAVLRGRPEWITLGFLEEAIESSRRQRVCRYELWPINQLSGWQARMAQLAAVQLVGTETARAEALARWAQLPRYLDTEIRNLREGVRRSYTTPKHNVQLVIEQLDDLLVKPAEQWPFYGPAERDKSVAFQSAWKKLLTERIAPAIERYRAYLRDEYLAKAREPIAITAHPQGEACYQASFRAYTTIERPGAETFALGREQVERNLAAALDIGRKSLRAGDLKTLVARINEDPANRFQSREQLLAFARESVARARKPLSQWFTRVPRADITVEPYPSFLEREANDGYWPAAEDGSRPAMYRIALYRFAATTRSNAEVTAFHEAYPGHHLQIGLALERPAAHTITRLVGNSAFAEGWARYAEALSEEMGLYSSDYARANRRLWPARGMVVDPGIHLFGWTREQATAFILESGRFPPETSAAAIDRIAVWPAQLTAYDTGSLEFFALREQAMAALGERFDIREFHDVVLGSGTVTLPMLREQVRIWLESKKAVSGTQ